MCRTGRRGSFMYIRFTVSLFLFHRRYSGHIIANRTSHITSFLLLLLMSLLLLQLLLTNKIFNINRISK
uniref:Uncharacterized protein n=1 Tax=Panstrongylus lignarius TaxID=156445 RepID=A0A224Y6U9_9HEMI